MSYEVRYDVRVKDDVKRLDKASTAMVQKVIKEKLIRNPLLFGKPLRHSLVGFRVLRVGKYRVVYIIEKKIVSVLLIGDRKHVYKEALKRIGK